MGRDEGAATSTLWIMINAKDLQIRAPSSKVDHEIVFANCHWAEILIVVLLGRSSNSGCAIAISSLSLCGMDKTILVVGMNVSRQGAPGMIGLDTRNTRMLRRRQSRARQGSRDHKPDQRK